jgi:mannose-1-phosphate guanylyltransferase
VLIENSVVFEYSRLGPGLCLVDKLVYGRYCVDQAGVSVDLSSADLDWLITDARKLPGELLESLISQDLVKSGF